jgi:hypothetical protein
MKKACQQYRTDVHVASQPTAKRYRLRMQHVNTNEMPLICKDFSAYLPYFYTIDRTNYDIKKLFI